MVNNMLNTPVRIATGLTDGGPTHLDITNVIIEAPALHVSATVVESLFAQQNAEPIILYGHLSPTEALVAFLQTYIGEDEPLPKGVDLPGC